MTKNFSVTIFGPPALSEQIIPLHFYLYALHSLSSTLALETLQDLREAFRIFDKDRSGFIEAREIIAVTTTLGQALDKDELEAFMAEADLDGDGRLNYEEFCRIMTKND